MPLEESLDTIQSDVETTTDSDAPASGGEGGETTTDAGTDTETESGSPEGNEQEGTDGDQSGDAATGGTEPPAGIKPEIWALIQQFATETGYDPKDARDLKALRRMAEKEYRIQELEGKAGKPSHPGLTEFEQGALEGDEDAAAEQTAAGEQPGNGGEPLPPGKYGDIGDQFESAADFYKAEEAAWAEPDEAKRYATVHKIQLARTVRMIDALVGPHLRDLGEKLERFEREIAPEVRQTVLTKQLGAAHTFAVEALEKVPEYQTIRDLFKVDDDTQIEHDGGRFANTAFNRVMRDNPEILDIQVSPNDPDAKALAKKHGITPQEAATKLRYIRVYRAAAKFAKAHRVEPAQAKQLMDAGARVAQRDQKDRVRQRLNAGGTSTSNSGSARPSSAGSRPERLEDLLK